MHAESRTGIYLADAAAGLAIGLGDIPGQEIHAADIKSNGLDRSFGHFAIVRMHRIGHVDGSTTGGQICSGSQVHRLAFLRHGVSVVTELFEQTLRLLIEFKPCQHFLMPDAAPRILVHRVHELFDRMLTVTGNVTRHALGARNKMPVDHQQAMVKALDKAFHDDVASMFACLVESHLDFFVRLEIDRHSTTVVAGQWFQNDRVTYAPGGSLGVV